MSRIALNVSVSLLIGVFLPLLPALGDQVMTGGFVPSRVSPIVRDLNQEIQGNPSAANYKSRAEALRRLGMRKEAMDDLNSTINLEPENVAAHVLRGRVYFEDGMYPEAISNLNTAIKYDPKFEKSYVLRACSYLRLKEYSKAVDDANTILALNSKSAVAYQLRGAAYNGLGKYSNAIDDCTQAINLDPKLDKAYYWRAEAYQNAGDYQKSVDDFTEAIKLEPAYRPALIGRAWSNYKLGKTKEALQDCNEGISFHDAEDLIAFEKYVGEKATLPDIVPDPEYNLGQQIEEDLKNSLVLYDDVLKDKPGDPDALRYRGIANMHLSKYHNAYKDFVDAAKGLPENPTGFSGLGSEDAYNSAVPEYKKGNEELANNNYAAAIKHYQAALKLYPTYGRCWHNLAIASSALGDDFTAELCSVHAISYRPRDWMLWSTLGRSLYREYKRDKGDPTKLKAAAQAFHQSLQLNPDTEKDKNELRRMLSSVKSYERSLAPVNDFIFTTMPII